MAKISDYPEKKGNCSICGQEIKTGGFWDGDIDIHVCRDEDCIQSLIATVFDAIFDEIPRHSPIKDMRACGKTIEYWTTIFEKVFWNKVSLELFRKQQQAGE